MREVDSRISYAVQSVTCHLIEWVRHILNDAIAESIEGYVRDRNS